MLDDLAYIARVDSDNALAVAAGLHEQLLYQDFEVQTVKSNNISNVVFTGMGGSALAGLLTRSWLEDELPVPFVITRDYTLPKFVDKNSLVIVSSYSGNTEETLAAFEDAKKKSAQIFVISAGGKLSELAETQDLPLLRIPTGYQPRMTAGFGIKLTSSILEAMGLISPKADEIKKAHQLLGKSIKAYLPQTKTADNRAKQIAEEVVGKIPVVYGSPLLSTAAYKWKINLNENAKNLAFCNELPEFSHNEFIGWSGKPEQKPLAVIQLQSRSDHSQISKRFEVTNRLLSGKMPQPIEIQAEGKSKLEQILWSVQLGDMASIYLAILNQINPTPVDLVEKFKKEL